MRPRVGTILILAGSAALVWCLTVLAGTALYEYLSRGQLARTSVKSTPLMVHKPRPYDVVGRIEIPRLHLSTVILEGDDDRALRYGAGHVPSTALPDEPGNVAIAAHRDTFFRPLRHIAPDDRITLSTPDGVFHYVVESTELVGPKDVRVLDPSRDPELTLITCYPFYYVGPAPKRFIVHARRTS
jgi:sortase A